jgi:aminoglycoside 3-N-acetyltransferase
MKREFLGKRETALVLAPVLNELGVEPGKTVLIHSAFGSLSRQGFLAEYFLESILEFIGDGTLALPAMSWREVSPAQPVFHEMETRSNVGVLSETFRLKYAERRSLHPTHSVVAAGSNTDYLLEDHHLDVRPCSEDSPWGRLANMDAQILLIDLDMDNCTLIHHLEETRAPDVYLREEVEAYTCVGRDGSSIEVGTRRHRKLYRNFYKFRDILADLGQLKVSDLGNCRIYGFKAADIVACVSAEFDRTTAATIAGPGEKSKLM